ncbi:MAG TPA: S1 RNA-binding domain-containing protein [Anaeromyxobacteraceae bacterium]|nr:S1 RNA-binding domain-containing protein [Anaeromyxobacteraceae bacterium]
MPDEKKPASAGPVVIRKGHVKPPPPGSTIEPPQVERLAPEPRPAASAAEDRRPLWQRVAAEASPPQPPLSTRSRGEGGSMEGSGPRRGPREGGPPRRDRNRGERGDRGERRDRRPRFGGEERGAPEGEARAPILPAGEPPPAPEPIVADEGSFAEMFAEADAQPRRRFQIGEKVAGKIIQLGHDVAFLELGSGVAEAMIEVHELADAEGQVAARVGDIVDGVVVEANERGVRVAKGLQKGPRDHRREAVIEAAHTGLPVEGVVKAANKGGLEVEVLGQRAFCPMSQIDVRFVGDPATFVGQKLQFRVQRADQRDVVLSRRALLEEERAAKARATRERLAPGAVFDGVVTSVQDYGAFVDIGGVEGLVHVSELSWDRVSKPQDLLKAGDAVQVQVLRIDEDPKKGERIGLSVKTLAPRPEPVAAAPAEPRPARPAPPPPPKVGDVVVASVDKIEPFGIFVRFAGGRGLVPASETGTPRGSDLRRAFKVGDTFNALVTAIDDQHRIRLSRTEAEAAAERAEAAEYLRKAAPKTTGKGFGTLGDLLRAKLEKK